MTEPEILKTKFIQLRVSETLKKRYTAALVADGITQSDHLNAIVIRYVEEHEKRSYSVLNKKAALK